MKKLDAKYSAAIAAIVREEAGEALRELQSDQKYNDISFYIPEHNTFIALSVFNGSCTNIADSIALKVAEKMTSRRKTPRAKAHSQFKRARKKKK